MYRLLVFVFELFVFELAATGFFFFELFDVVGLSSSFCPKPKKPREIVDHGLAFFNISSALAFINCSFFSSANCFFFAAAANASAFFCSACCLFASAAARVFFLCSSAAFFLLSIALSAEVLLPTGAEIPPKKFGVFSDLGASTFGGGGGDTLASTGGVGGRVSTEPRTLLECVPMLCLRTGGAMLRQEEHLPRHEETCIIDSLSLMASALAAADCQ